MIMQALSVAAVKISCWVIVESFVSRYEDHFYLKRNMNEESVNEEFEIAVNGPNLANSDSVIKKALNRHWEGGCWHFYKPQWLRKWHKVTQQSVLKRMWNTKHNLPFMDKCKIKLQWYIYNMLCIWGLWINSIFFFYYEVWFSEEWFRKLYHFTENISVIR